MSKRPPRAILVQEIYKHAELLNSNKTTLVFLLAMQNDRELTKFHAEYLAVKPKEENDSTHTN
jgi:hypothetical protein